MWFYWDNDNPLFKFVQSIEVDLRLKAEAYETIAATTYMKYWKVFSTSIKI